MSLPVLQGVAVLRTGTAQPLEQNLTLRHGVLFGETRSYSVSGRRKWNFVLQNCQIRIDKEQSYITLKRSGDLVRLQFYYRIEAQTWYIDLKLSIVWSVQSFYALRNILGSGSYGALYAAKHLRSHYKVVIKTLFTSGISALVSTLHSPELRILMKLSHVRLMYAQDVLVGSDAIYVAQPLMAGGSLSDFIRSRGVLSENEARDTVRSVLSGLQILQFHKVSHCNIKPSNVFLSNDTFPLNIRIGDFRNARFVLSDGAIERYDRIESQVEYCAPEIIRGDRCGPAIDIWACGVMMHWLLSGHLPFYGNTPSNLRANILSGSINIQGSPWKHISGAAIDFLIGLLHTDVSRRMPVGVALGHEWMRL